MEVGHTLRNVVDLTRVVKVSLRYSYTRFHELGYVPMRSLAPKG